MNKHLRKYAFSDRFGEREPRAIKTRDDFIGLWVDDYGISGWLWDGGEIIIYFHGEVENIGECEETIWVKYIIDAEGKGWCENVYTA